MTKVYILSDHREYGAENIVATLDHAKVPELISRYCEGGAEQYRAHALQRFASLPPGLHRETGYPLFPGWGGLQLHVVELS